MNQVRINQTVIELVIGDITRQETDAIVNAANSSLLGGGGVDGAIHRAAGPDLLKETRELGGCRTGEAKISGGYRLAAKHVIHAVGPVYQFNDPHVRDHLASAHRRSLELALEHQLTSIAFPAISTGIYGYPVNEAAPIALETVMRFAEEHTQITLIRFVLFTQDTYDQFAQALDRLIEP